MKLAWLLVDDPIAKPAVEAAEANAVVRINRLTAREKEVLHLMTNGFLDKQFAHELSVSPITIDCV